MNDFASVADWKLLPAETTFVWQMGNPYPVAVVCTLYEENSAGEKRLVESKTLKIVEGES